MSDSVRRLHVEPALQGTNAELDMPCRRSSVARRQDAPVSGRKSQPDPNQKSCAIMGHECDEERGKRRTMTTCTGEEPGPVSNKRLRAKTGK